MSSIERDRFLRIKDVMMRTGLGRSSVYSRIQSGGFPVQIKLSERTSVWSENSILDWIEEQKEKAKVGS